MKHKNKNHVAEKTVKAMMRGIVVEWECVNEEDGDVFVPTVTSKNKMINMTGAAGKIFHDLYDIICNKIPMRWIIKITVMFRYDNGIDQFEEREIEAFCLFNDITSHVNAQKADALRHGAADKYFKTRYRVECL